MTGQPLTPPEPRHFDDFETCPTCKTEEVEDGDYCSQACAFKAGVAEERERCLTIADNYTDVIDGPDGTPRPNLAMRIMTEIEGR